jgi:tartrate-resistant acid phosphatase type 5
VPDRFVFIRMSRTRDWTAIVLVAIVQSSSSSTTADIGFSFITIGDSGEVGPQLSSTAHAMTPFDREASNEFIAMVGDNFYPGGLSSSEDSAFDDVFLAHFSSMKGPFHPVLGDNDYGHHETVGSLHAQTLMSSRTQNWVMPGLYYTRHIERNDVSLCAIFIDTQSLLSIPHLDFRSPEEIMELSAQLVWLEGTLASPTCQLSDFIVVFGHHTLISAGKKFQKGKSLEISNTLIPLLSKYNVEAYFSGHDHDLQVIKKQENSLTFIVSGASSRLRKVPIQVPLPGYNQWGEFHTAGFTITRVNGTQMETSFIASDTGHVIHTEVTKSHKNIRINLMK